MYKTSRASKIGYVLLGGALGFGINAWVSAHKMSDLEKECQKNLNAKDDMMTEIVQGKNEKLNDTGYMIERATSKMSENPEDYVKMAGNAQQDMYHIQLKGLQEQGVNVGPGCFNPGELQFGITADEDRYGGACAEIRTGSKSYALRVSDSQPVLGEQKDLLDAAAGSVIDNPSGAAKYGADKAKGAWDKLVK
ncbi:MAG: hypothetical protein R6U32_01325 [Candidatus Woesearchaeota archaeon]